MQETMQQIGEGFWNIRGNFKLLGGLVDMGNQMSIAKLSNGKFLIIDAIPMTDQIKAEIDKLTDKGANIEAVITTHPFHTLSIQPFHEAYPNVPFYGCPRHIKRFPDLKWAGDLNDCKVRSKWNPDVDLRIPEGAEFVSPVPERTNHFISVFVFHKQSKTIHVDDTIMFSQNPGFLLKLAGFKEGTMMLHPAIKGPGLLPHPEAPFQFRDWIKKLIDDWDFDNLCAAHFGCKIGGAKQQLTEVVKKAEPLFQKLNNKRKDPNYKFNDEIPSNNVKGDECG